MKVSKVESELIFWQDNIRELNGLNFAQSFPIISSSFNDLLCGDASATGYYICSMAGGQETVHSRPFSDWEVLQSSTWRESKLVEETYAGKHAEKLAGRTIHHWTDNYGVSRIFSIGSSNIELQQMAVEVYKRCRHLNITLQVEWHRRTEEFMQIADKGSRGPWRQHENFTVDWDTACKIIGRSPDVDCFADHSNKLCVRYYSLNFEIEAEGQDFFAQYLNRYTVYYVHPHPNKLLEVLKHLWQARAKGIVMMHLWRIAIYPCIVQQDHLPCVATRPDWCQPDFKPGPGLYIPAFSGRKHFWSVIFDVNFNNFHSFEAALSPLFAKSHCVLGGCIHCC